MKKKQTRPDRKNPIKLTPAVKKKLRAAGKKAIAQLKKNHAKGIYKTAAATEASIGNQWWLRRSKHGRDKLFADPQLMWDAACEYFENSIKYPMFTKKDWKSDRGKLKLVEVPLPNVFTLAGLCTYMDVSTSYFIMYRTQLKKDDPNARGFITVIGNIEQIIYDNKFLGASNGAYNANFMAYALGIRHDVPNQAAGMIVNVENNNQSSVLDEVKRKLEDIDKSE